MIVRRCALLTLTLGVCACTIDDRKLEPALEDDGVAGAFAGRDAATGSGGGAGATGTPDSALVDGCADLDTDGIADCETTLVQNPSFTSDVSGWTAQGDAKLFWDPKNELEDLPSGSAMLSAGTRRASASQCVALSGAQLVIAYASAFVQAPGDADKPATANLEVSFFQGNGCAGASNGYFETPASAGIGSWT